MNIIFVIILTLISNYSIAALEVNIIKQNQESFPILISPFSSNNNKQSYKIAEIMSNNLNRSGDFNARSAKFVINSNPDFNKLKNQGIEAIVVGKLTKKSQKIFNIDISLLDVFSKKTLYSNKFAVHNSGTRRIAHFLSDQIYQSLLGIKGAFDTRLAYVTVSNLANNKKEYKLEISDSDANNAQTVLRSNSPVLSPVWSPEQDRIAYVSFKNNRSEVFIQYPFMRRKTEKLPYFNGIASSPAWHPNGKSLLLTLSKDGNKDIYSYSLVDKELTRITHNPGIDTEGSYSPDGKKIVFTSNRTGLVQVYIKNLLSGKINRATFQGSYNAKAVFSPNGKTLALVHKQNKNYRIALLDIKTKDLTVMTHGKLDESPFFSPNGKMIIFSSQKGNIGMLSVVSIQGKKTFELFAKIGEVREPNWSNYSQ